MVVLLTILATMTQDLMIFYEKERGNMTFLSDAGSVDDNDSDENDVKGVQIKVSNNIFGGYVGLK